MSLRYWYRDNDGAISEFTSRVNIKEDEGGRFFTGEQVAEQGDTGGCEIVVDDPTGDFFVNGHRLVYVTSTEIITTTKTIWMGYTARRVTKRMAPWSGAARQIAITCVDLNTHLDRRVGVGDNWKRPAETDVERVQFMLGEPEATLIEDITTYVSTDDPVDLDAADLRGQSLKAILDSCARQARKNFYITNVDAGDANGGTNVHTWTFWYGKDSLETYESDVRLTNDEGDLDADTWIVYTDAEHEQRPDRVHSGLLVNHDHGWVFRTRDATRQAFARIDWVASEANIKSAAKARAYADRELEDHATEEDIITCKVKIAESESNRLREGMRVQVKFLHFDGFRDEYVWCRVLRRSVRQLPPDNMEITYVLAAPVPAAASFDTEGILYMSHGPYGTDKLVYWDGTGDAPPAGKPSRPKTGLIDYLLDADPPNDHWPWYGWAIGGDGTLDVRFAASTIGVRNRAKSYTIQWTIRLNGAVVGSTSVAVLSDGTGLTSSVNSAEVTIDDLAVVNGDELTAHIVCTPNMAFFRSPAGVGAGGENFEITGGTLT